MKKTKQAKSSSFSRADLMQKCPLQFYFRHLEKIPNLAEDPPPGVERPLDRGIRLHDLAEDYVEGKLMKIPTDLKPYQEHLDKLKILYKHGIIELEKEYAFDADWNPCGYKDWDRCVYRGKGDVVIRPDEHNVIVIDYKTGKKDGNEVKHHEQCVEYGICEALMDPELQIFTLELWYFDQPLAADNPTSRTLTRTQLLRSFENMRNKHQKVLDEVLFPARPSRMACYFCDYKAGTVGKGKAAYPGTGHCRRNVC